MNYPAPLVQLEFSTGTGTICWDNETGNGLWTTLLNWSTDVLPTAGDDVVIDLGGISTVTLDDTGVTHTIDSLLLTEALDFVNGTLVISGTDPSIPTGDLTLSSASVVFNGATIAGNINVVGGDLDGAGDITATGLVNWTAGDIKGAGKLIAQGGWDINNPAAVSLFRDIDLESLGRWLANGVGGISTANINVMPGQILDLQSSTNFQGITAAINLASGASLIKTGSAAATTVRVGVNSGLVESSNGSLVVSGGGNHTGGILRATAPGFLSFGGGGAFDFDAATQVTGDGGLSFGPGTYNLDASYSGTGTINAANGGIVNFNTSATLPSVTVQNGATINLNGPSFSIGALALTSNSNLAVNGGVTLTGTTNWQSGTLTGAGSTFDVAPGATLAFAAGTHNFGGNATFQGGGTVEVSGAAWNVNGNLALNTQLDASAGSISGAGNVTFNTPGQTHNIDTTYAITGNTTVTGTNTLVDVCNGTNFGGLTLAGGGDVSLQGVSNNINNLSLQDASSALTVAGNLNTTTTNLAAGTISGAGSWSNTGTLTATGATTVGLGFTNTGTVNANGGTLSYTSAYVQTAGLTRLNGGALSMPGTGLQLNGGTLAGNGAINGNVNADAATVAPGASPGILNINGNLNLTSNSVINAELGGVNPVPPDFDIIDVTGTASLDGTLNVLLFGGFTGAPNDSFNIITSPSVTSDFINVNFPATHTFSSTNLGTFYQLLLLSLSLPDPLAGEGLDGTDEVVILEQNLFDLITQFAISKQEGALRQALPGVTCK